MTPTFSKLCFMFVAILALTISSCSKDSVNGGIPTDVIEEKNSEPLNPPTTTNTFTGVTAQATGSLVGSYNSQGTFTADANGIHFQSDFRLGTAPGPGFYLSNSTVVNSSSISIGLPPAQSGATTLETTAALDYQYLILWCIPFSTRIAHGEIPRP